MPRIHPSAIVDPQAQLADDVEVGPFAVIEDNVKIGPGCRLASHVVIRRHTTMGRGNHVDSFTVIGGLAQDHKADPADVSCVRIGDDNVFREGVTISRGTGPGATTIVGNGTYWMTASHAGHNSAVEDGAILVNGSALGGHSRLGRRAILSGNVMIHQFCWVGDMAMSQGNSGASMHIPPYTIFARGINWVVGLNVVGLRRAPGFSDEDRRQIRDAYRLLYRAGLTPAKALECMETCTDWGAPAAVFRDFIRRVVEAKKPFNRGIAPLLRTSRRALDRGDNVE